MTGWQWETEMEWLTVRAGLACCGGVGGVQCGVRRAAPLTHSLTERVDTLPTATLRHCDTLDTNRDCAFLLFALISRPLDTINNHTSNQRQCERT